MNIQNDLNLLKSRIFHYIILLIYYMKNTNRANSDLYGGNDIDFMTELRDYSIIKYLVLTFTILRYFLHLFQLLSTGISLRKYHTHLIPTFSELLIVYFVLDGEFFEVLVEFFRELLEVLGRMLINLAQME